MTKVIILKDGGNEGGEVKQNLKPIEPVKLLDIYTQWTNCNYNMSEELKSFDYIELICRCYNSGSGGEHYDLFFAYDAGDRNDGTLFLGHWNDGVVDN